MIVPGPSPVARFWAKTGDDGGHHPLIAHSADVASVLRALTEPGTALFDRLMRAAGPTDPDRLRCTLVYLAALHDLGKANHGFQDKAGPWARPERAKRWPTRGHVIPVIASIHTRGPFLQAMTRLLTRLPLEDAARSDAFLTAIAHHGRPWRSDPSKRAGPLWAQVWAPDTESGRDPIAEIERLSDRAIAWSGMQVGGEPLPWPAALSNFFAGVLTISDWIGSTERVFEPAPEADDDPDRYWAEACGKAHRAVRQIGVRPSEVRRLSGEGVYAELFPDVFIQNAPTQLQKLVAEIDLPEPGSRLVIESETGSGKTEAVLALYSRLRTVGRVDGLVFALPTRATAKAMHDRVRDCVAGLHPHRAMPPITLAMGGETSHDAGDEGAVLDPNWYPDQDARVQYRWASETHKKFFAAEIVVGTVDQILLAGLPVKHAHMRLALLSRHLIVVDEIHSYDRYMNAVLNRVMDYHCGVGGVSVFLSATLSRTARNGLTGQEVDLDWRNAVEAPYPSLSIHEESSEDWRQIRAETSGRPKSVEWSVVSQAARGRAVFDEAVRVAREGGRVCILRNTVKDARSTVQTLSEIAPEVLWTPGSPEFAPAYHSRYIAGDRQRLDEAVLADFGKQSVTRGVILVATQVIEQSLDVDFDWMMTDLAPVDVLLQRVGRLHRHGRLGRPAAAATARMVVQAPEEPFPPRIASYGPFGWGTVYEDWSDLELTRRLIVDRPLILIPRHNRLLVEAVYHPDARQAFTELAPEWEEAINSADGRKLGLETAGAMGALALSRGYPDQERQYRNAQGEKIRTRIGDDCISVTLDRPVTGWYDRDAKASEVNLRIEQLRGSRVELSDPSGTYVGEDGRGPVYQIGVKLRMRYGPEGWVRETDASGS
jgi:CRISPR-associated endonuclease/helicase Cas3